MKIKIEDILEDVRAALIQRGVKDGIEIENGRFGISWEVHHGKITAEFFERNTSTTRTY
jgi:hypothetical protein